jgi:exopolysaccharide biosynthesis protein
MMCANRCQQSNGLCNGLLSLLLVSVSLIPSTIFSQEHTIQIDSDTLVQEGVRHIAWSSNEPRWAGDIIIADLNSKVSLKTTKANEQLLGYQKTQIMAENYTNSTRKKVIAAINGDFYKRGGIPVHSQVIDGEILKAPVTRDALAITSEGGFLMGTFDYSASVRHDGRIIALNGLNQARGEHELILYNSYYGDSTKTNSYGFELILKQLSFKPINEAETFVVMEPTEATNGLIPEGHIVLSAHGDRIKDLQSFTAGDTVEITHQLRYSSMAEEVEEDIVHSTYSIVEFMGGSKTFVQSGVVNGNWPERHPRSAIGINADSTQVYLFTVDGRQEHSVGMTLTEMGHVMKGFGVWHALNLDGGGSTTLILKDKVVNSPSDATGQRWVSNAILLVQEQ